MQDLRKSETLCPKLALTPGNSKRGHRVSIKCVSPVVVLSIPRILASATAYTAFLLGEAGIANSQELPDSPQSNKPKSKTFEPKSFFPQVIQPVMNTAFETEDTDLLPGLQYEFPRKKEKTDPEKEMQKRIAANPEGMLLTIDPEYTFKYFSLFVKGQPYEKSLLASALGRNPYAAKKFFFPKAMPSQP